jgi:hypothetical protein
MLGELMHGVDGPRRGHPSVFGAGELPQRGDLPDLVSEARFHSVAGLRREQRVIRKDGGDAAAQRPRKALPQLDCVSTCLVARVADDNLLEHGSTIVLALDASGDLADGRCAAES